MGEVRSRKWFGTVWDENDLKQIKKLKYQYLIISAQDQTSEQHVGVQSEHWHVFIQFRSNRKRPQTSTAHWENPRSITGAVSYCKSKGEPLFEDGGLQINSGDKNDWQAFLEVAQTTPKEQMLTGPFSKFVARYPRFTDELYSTSKKYEILDGELKNLWIWGDAGKGKTLWVWKNCSNNLYVKNINKWWDNYKDQKYVLIDDWDPSHKMLAHHLKQWADRYPFQGEKKGAGREMRPQHIIVTSNYAIDQCFEKEDIEAIRRRFISVHSSHLHLLTLDQKGEPYLMSESEYQQRLHTTEYSMLGQNSNTICSVPEHQGYTTSFNEVTLTYSE